MTDRPSERDDEEEFAAAADELRGQRKKVDTKLPLSNTLPEPPNPSATERPKRHGLLRRGGR